MGLSVRRNDLARRLFGFGLAFVAALSVPLTLETRATAATYPSPQAIEDAFHEGLRALAARDAGTAIRIFRSILAQDPDLPRVRLELARAYFLAREWERSRREFFAVLSGDVPETVKANVIKFLRAIDARRGFDWNLSVSVSASPQATRRFDTDTILVNFLGTPVPFEIQRDDSGQYGVDVAGSAEYRHEFPALSSDKVRVTGLLQAFFDVFEGNGGAADDYLIGSGLGLRGAWPQTTLSGLGVVSIREFGGQRFQDRYEFHGIAEWRGRSGLSLFASGAAGFVDDHLAETRDGRTARLRGGVAKSLGGRSILGLALNGEEFDAEEGFESYLTLGAEMFGSTDLGAGVDAFARVFFLKQDYDARNPLHFERRKEEEYGFDLEVSKADIFLLDHFTPFVRVGFSRRNSSIDAFSYNEYRFNVGIRKTF